MKKITNFFKNIFFYFSRRKKLKELDEIQARLELAVVRQERRKNRLRMHIIWHFNRQFMSQSKYIKAQGKSAHHIRVECEKKFGEKMKEVGLKLNDKLELV